MKIGKPKIFYLLPFAFLILIICCVQQEPLNSKKWKLGGKSRYPMVLTIIHQPILQGKTRSEIEKALGNPDQKDEDSFVYFYDDGGIFGVHFSTPYLMVSFDSKSGKCDKIST